MKHEPAEFDVIQYIRENFIYHENGTFTRKDRRNWCGSLDKDGYWIIKIKKKQYKAHRLVFAYHNGRFPDGEIDHINRNRTDNRIENLRECTRTENVRNITPKANPDTGVVGVYLDKCTHGLKSKYTFRVGGKTYRCRTLEEAVRKKEKLNGDLRKAEQNPVGVKSTERAV